MARSSVELIVDASKAINPLKRVTAETKKLESSVGKAQSGIRRTNRAFKETGRVAERASKGVNKLGGAIRGLVAGFGAFQAGKFVIFKTAELERQTKSLEVLTGSLGNARNIISELQQFGAVTPFTSSELIETAKRLKAFGFETEQVVNVTKRLADVAGATGADLGGIATAFGQIQAKGRLQGEELLQLQERGVGLQDELQKMYGLTADEFRKALEGGRISADAVNLALQNITDTGGKYANGAIAQSDTLAGKFSTLVDGIENISRNIGEVLSPALKGVLGLAIDVVNSINAAFNAQKRLTGFGIGQEERNRLFRQADAEALQIAKLRAGRGGAVDSGEFTRIRAQRFSDLINQFGFDTGQLIPEISAVSSGTKIPDLLKKPPATGKTEEERRLEAIEKQQKAAKALLLTKKQEALLTGDITEQQRASLEHVIEKMNLSREFPLLSEKELQVLRDQLDVNFDLEQAHKDRIQAAKNLKNQQDQEAERVKQLAQQYQGIADTLADGVVNALKGAVDGTTSLAQAATNMLNDLANQMLQLARNMLFFGNIAGSLVPGGGLLGSIFGGFMANGGTVTGGRSYMVGEKGPVLFTPGRTGSIAPSGSFGGANVVVNVDASGTQAQGDQPNAKALGAAIGAAVQAELVKQKRPGGLLS